MVSAGPISSKEYSMNPHIMKLNEVLNHALIGNIITDSEADEMEHIFIHGIIDLKLDIHPKE